MKRSSGFLASLILFSVVLSSNAFAITDGVYSLTQTGYAWDGTNGKRLQAVTADYDHAYGDEESLTYTLPWTFTFYGQPYTQINMDTNGNIWFSATGAASSFSLPNAGRGPVISAWNNDLSSYFRSGVFVQHKTNPERVVVEWKSETYTHEGTSRPSNFEAVLFQSGDIRIDYNSFSPAAAKDFGSGISQDDNQHYLSISAAYGDVYTHAGHSFSSTYQTPVTSVTLTASVPSPHMIGTPVTFTAAASGGSGTVEYSFYRQLLGATTNTLVQNYSVNNTLVWNPTTADAETYTIMVYARNVGSTAAYQASRTINYSVVVDPPVTGVTLTASPASPQRIGTVLTFTAVASGGTGSYQYRFLRKDPGATTFTMVQNYSSNNTLTWNTAGAAAGTYQVQVRARNVGSKAVYEALQILNYNIVVE